ncbi:MAG: hypothetical protein SFW67_12845 [Myxococcaceae bacterium]|nr:hypothetical protein [Myxococcaceae bacterium]
MAQSVQELISRFDEIHARYKGVRGELLAKVRDDLVKPGAASTKDVLARFDAVATKYKGVRGELLAKVREQLVGDPATPASAAKPAPVVARPAPVVAKPAPVMTKPTPVIVAPPPPPPVQLQPQASIESVRQLRRSTPEQKAAVANMLPSCRVCGRGMKLAGSGTLMCEKGHVRNLAG